MPVFSLFVHVLKKKYIDEIKKTLLKKEKKSWYVDMLLFYLKIK